MKNLIGSFKIIVFALSFCFLFTTPILAEDKTDADKLDQTFKDIESALYRSKLNWADPQKNKEWEKKFDNMWEALSMEEKREMINKKIEDVREEIEIITRSLNEEAKIYPYKGLGIIMHPKDEKITIGEILKNSPAVEKLKHNDCILSVNGTTAYWKNVEEIINIIKNSEDKVTLIVARGKKEITLILEKAMIGNDLALKIKNINIEWQENSVELISELSEISAGVTNLKEKEIKSVFVRMDEIGKKADDADTKVWEIIVSNLVERKHE